MCIPARAARRRHAEVFKAAGMYDKFGNLRSRTCDHMLAVRVLAKVP